jgi:hypothetical protein
MAAMTQEQLKPCPKCLSPAEMHEIGNDHTKKRRITVKCTNKNCRLERTDAAFRNGMDWLRNVAIEEWNARAEQPAPEGMVMVPRESLSIMVRQAVDACDPEYGVPASSPLGILQSALAQAEPSQAKCCGMPSHPGICGGSFIGIGKYCDSRIGNELCGYPRACRATGATNG